MPLDELLTYLEACLRVYNRYGRRDNKYKARIKILVHETGRGRISPPGRGRVRAPAEDARASIRRWPSWSGSRPILRRSAVRSRRLSDELDRCDPDFAVWVDQQRASRTRQPGYAIVNDQPEAGRRHSRRRLGRRRSHLMAELDRALQLRRTARHPCAEHRPAACAQGRSPRAVAARSTRPGLGTAQPRPDQRHHRLPGPRLLQPRQCPLDPGRAEDRRALRRSRRASATWAN